MRAQIVLVAIYLYTDICAKVTSLWTRIAVEGFRVSKCGEMAS